MARPSDISLVGATKRVRLSFREKVSLVTEVEERSRADQPTTHAELARKYGVSRSAVSSILKEFSKKTVDEKDKLANDTAKASSVARFPIIDQAVFRVFLEARSSNLPVTGLSLQELAKEFAKEAGLEDRFVASAGWLENFKHRYNIRAFRISGEAGAVDKTLAQDARSKLTELIAGYAAEDVFNLDETGLFYNALPSTTLSHERGAVGGKAAKDRITLLVGANITGTEKLKLDLIGKSKSPRCLKNVDMDGLPVHYHSQTNSWMDSSIFEAIMKRLNRHFALADRKVLVLVDNCSCHASVLDLELSCIRVHFLPPNMTSVIQPCDQGIIQALKLNYRSRLLAVRLAELRATKEADPMAAYTPRSLNILEVMRLASAAWNAVSPKTINACWGKADITPSAYIARATDVPRCPAGWTELADQVMSFASLSGMEGVNPAALADVYVDFDHDEKCHDSLSREQVVEDLHAYRDAQTAAGLADTTAPAFDFGDSDSSDDSGGPSGPTPKAALAWARNLQSYITKRSPSFGSEVVDAMVVVRAALDQHVNSIEKKQTKLTDFFSQP